MTSINNTHYQPFLFLLFLFLSFPSFAQKDRPLVIEKSSLPCIKKTFNVVAHVVRSERGPLVTTPEDIQASIKKVNQLFAPICIQFQICEIDTIENSQYDTLQHSTEWAELAVTYGQAYKINIYFVGDIEYIDACGIAGVGGISSPMSTQGILLPCNGALAHEMGHFFGLRHTFGGGTERTEELVKAGNCATTGDFVCDTPADPYITRDSIKWYVQDPNCRFIDLSQDLQGEWYVPHVTNIMSYYPCAKDFTDGQYRRMVDTYLKNPRMW